MKKTSKRKQKTPEMDALFQMEYGKNQFIKKQIINSPAAIFNLLLDLTFSS